MCIFSLLQKQIVSFVTAKMITNKEKTGLQTMYNLDKVPKNLPVLFLIKEGAVESSQ